MQNYEVSIKHILPLSVLNQQSTFDVSVLDELPQRATLEQLSKPPTMDEALRAIKEMSSGKAPGRDAIPSEVYKYGDEALVTKLVQLYGIIWEQESVPQDFKDATIVHLFKHKGDRLCCDNHRGITLLSTAGKILARIILNRINSHLVHSIIPESQCGFRAGRGTTDMIFTARQIQEKCREQHRELYLVFVDLTKAFDSVSRDGLWMVLRKVGCPDKLVNIIRSLHDGMTATVLDGGEMSEPFDVTNGTKQGCVLAPVLFSIFFSAVLEVAFRGSNLGIPIEYRTDGGVFNLSRLRAKTKVTNAVIRELLFADDCALVSNSLSDIQRTVDCFAIAVRRFGLTISLKKTEVVLQPKPGRVYSPPVISIEGTALKVVDRFCYLGSTLSQGATLDDEITARLGRASAAFGRLTKRLWKEHGIRLQTKISVYRAVVLTTLLYGCETWCLYRKHVKLLDQFHLRCLRKIANIRWEDKVPNTEVLEKCQITGIEAMLMQAQFRWAGHLARMDNNRIPKTVFYGQLKDGTRTIGGQRKRYKDTLKANFKACSIDWVQWEAAAQNRTIWRTDIHRAIRNFEHRRTMLLQEKRERRKAGMVAQRNSGHLCDICGKACASRIGLFAHRRAHVRRGHR